MVKTVQGEEGQYILQVAEKYGLTSHHVPPQSAGAGRHVPHLHGGACLTAAAPDYVTACNYPIWEGMEVTTDSEDGSIQGRKLIVELLLARCPEVPLLQKLAKSTASRPAASRLKRTPASFAVCVPDLRKNGRQRHHPHRARVDMEVDTPFHTHDRACIACGACASVCPTGHITLEKIKAQVTAKREGRTHPIRI
jgi:ferredoxin